MAGKRNSGNGKWFEVARVAEAQHGVVARAQLRNLGLTDAAIEHAVATGRLHRLFPAAFAVGHRRVGTHGRMLAATLVCGKGTVVSHGTAAILLGLWDHSPALADVIAPVESGRKIDGIRRRHVPRPVGVEIEVRDGIPCTSPSRTLVDIASIVGERSLRRTVERAAVLRMLDVAAVDASLSRHRRRGSRLLRAVLEDWGVAANPVLLRSDLEARLLPLIVARGLPVPLCNQKKMVGGRRMELDLLWPERRLVVEGDGRKVHDTAVAFERDRKRDRDLVRAGYRVLRITWKQLEREADEIVTAIAQLLRG
jgi:very-short-patch-repair endonuclease